MSRTLLLLVLWTSIASVFSQGKSQNSPVLTEVCRLSNGDLFATTYCIYVSVSGYDVKNPDHFEFVWESIRGYLRVKPRDFLSIYFVDGYYNENKCTCNNTAKDDSELRRINIAYASISAMSPEKTDRCAFVVKNDLYGWTGSNMPIGVASHYKGTVLCTDDK